VTDLAITARCWEDLAALPPAVAEHILEVFAARRAVDPESGETMRGVGGPLRKFHADLSGGRSIRALTWYDSRPGGLLAAGGGRSLCLRAGCGAGSGRIAICRPLPISPTLRPMHQCG